MSIIKNALIESATITNDRGLSAWLQLNYGGSGQGFGGFVLWLPETFKHAFTDPANYTGLFISRCLEIGDVSEWAKLRGKTIRVKLTDEFGDIEAIGHIINDDWFNPKEAFAKLAAKSISYYGTPR